VLEAGCGVNAGLSERAVDDAEFHKEGISHDKSTKGHKAGPLQPNRTRPRARARDWKRVP
jgi:hypothetical protein